MKCYSVWHFVNFFHPPRSLLVNSNQQLNNNEILKELRALIFLLWLFSRVEDFLEKTFSSPLRPRLKFPLQSGSEVNGKFPRFMNFKLAISRRAIALDRDCNFHFSFPFSHCSTTCGSNGIFSRRLDFSLYNVLPKQRINSIEVKVIMEIFTENFF
jgi:hypothetical protein